MRLNISNIQHFSVGDGAGIRTTVFFKGCNLRCPWCHNPENLSAAPCVMHYAATGVSGQRGRSVTPEEILPELLEDKDFFDASGGGITLSGGEVMLQADGAAALCTLLSEHGIPALIDTAGCVPYREFEKLNPIAAGYLYDFKTADAARYRSIGGSLEAVSENLARLLADGAAVQVRIPVIPDFNDAPDEIENICASLAKLGVGCAELLPYHRLGSAKYDALGLEYAYKNRPPYDSAALDEIVRRYERHMAVTVER